MTDPTRSDDRALLQRSRAGDPEAFVLLLQRHSQPLRAFITRLISDPDDAQDVLQDTVVQAWLSLAQLQDPQRVRAWLLQIGRNRCRDHWKQQRRRPELMDLRDLELRANAVGRTAGPAATQAALAAMQELGSPSRETAELFYLGRLSVAEIARSLGCPEGTIKRRLHTARNQMRDHLLVQPEEGKPVSLFLINDQPQPFPETRPEFTTTPLPGPVPEVDWREVRNYYSLVELGDHTMWAMYEPPDWRLYLVYDQRMVGKVRVHGIEGLEMVADEYEEDAHWTRSRVSSFVRCDEARGQVLGRETFQDGTRVLCTFLDEGFDQDWWDWVPLLRDTGRFELQADGSIIQRHGQDDPQDNSGVAGRYLVTVGARQFECVRVLQVPGEPTDADVLMESFVRLDGRLIMDRRYNARLWGHARSEAYAKRGPWDQYLPNAERLVVDGVQFIHWYDCLGHIACGIDPGE